MKVAVRVVDLVKDFPRPAGYREILPFRKPKDTVTALAGISLQIAEGELFGLLGPNGAGKTTLMKILSTLILPTAGYAEILGHDVVAEEAEVKKRVGLITSDERSFYWRLTGRQNLEFFAALHRLSGHQARSRIDQLMGLLGLAEAADLRFNTFSTGMRQKMAIARGLLADPQVLLVDEPTRSLDPVSAQAVRAFLKKMVVTEGRTVLLATHQMSEAEQLCDRVAIVNRGRILACGRVSQLRLAYSRDHYYLEVETLGERLWREIAGIAGVRGLWRVGENNGATALEISMEDSRAVLPRVMEAIVAAGGLVHACSARERPLEEVFMDVIGDVDVGENDRPCTVTGAEI